MSRRESMSKLELLSRCGYWARDGVAWTRLTSSEATFGIAIHAMAAAYISGTVAAADAAASLSEDERAQLTAVWALVREWIDKNRRIGWRAEIAFAYDLETGRGRELPAAGDHRDYSAATATELPGTADLVYMGEDQSGPFACVDDWKWSGFHGDALRAESQLSGLGLAMASVCGVDRVRVRALRISDNGVDDTSEIYWLDVFALERVHADLVEQTRAVASAEPTPGPWCSDRWCPAIAECPRTLEAVSQVLPTSQLVPRFRLSPTIESREHAAWSLTAIDMVEEAAKKIRAELRAFADANGGIPLEDGTTWAGAEVAAEKPDLGVPGAVDELRGLGLEDAIEKSVTWAAIKRAAGPAGEKKAREALRTIGATKTSTHMRYEARAPKRAKSA